MIKIVLVISALFIFCAVAGKRDSHSCLVGLRARQARSDECYVMTCTNTNKPCSDSIVCSDYGTSCTNGTCTARLPLGSICNKATESSCIYRNCPSDRNVCIGDTKPGAPCSSKYECEYWPENGNACVNNRCVGPTLGEKCSDACVPPYLCGSNDTCENPHAQGEYCTENDMCAQPFVCINMTCSTPLSPGALCSTDDEENICQVGYVCSPTSALGEDGKCVQAFSQGEGAFCQQAYDCAEGLACNPDEAVINGYGNSNCSKVANNTFAACNYINDEGAGCANQQYCACDLNTGEGICVNNAKNNPVGSKKDYMDYVNCLGQCARTDYGCIASNCKKYVCAQTRLILPYFVDITYPKCYLDLATQFILYDGFITCDGDSGTTSSSTTSTAKGSTATSGVTNGKTSTTGSGNGGSTTEQPAAAETLQLSAAVMCVALVGLLML